MWIRDPESLALLDANDAAVELYGFTREELRAMTSSDLEQPQEAEQTDPLGTATEIRHRRKAGPPFEVRIRMLAFELAGRRAELAVVDDVSAQVVSEQRLRRAYAELENWAVDRTSELSRANADLRAEIDHRRRIEKELARERDLLRSLMDNIPDNIYFKDTSARFLRVNKAQARSLGLSDPDEPVGKTDFAFLAPEQARAAYADEQTIVRTGQPLLDKVGQISLPGGERRWVSATKAPIKDPSGRVVGIVGISRDVTERRSAEEEVRQARDTLAEQVRELERRTAEMTLLSEMAELFQACFTLEEAYSVIVRIAGSLFASDAGFVGVINGARTAVDVVAGWGASSPHPFSPQRCWGLRRGRLHVVDPNHAGMICPHVAPPLPAASLCIPMVAQGEAVGVLHLSQSEPFAQAKQRLAVTMAEQVAMALSSLKLRDTLHNQSIRDPLTGLFNRRFMEESLEREVRRAERSHRPLGLIMLDLDYFKRINDAFGHDAGDAVLREIGQFLRTHVRQEDIACRYGGEEFTLILPETSLETIRSRAEALCESARQLDVHHRHRALGPITVSLGVALFPRNGSSGSAVLQAADAALYRAKASGRDRVVVAD
jgi:diguanylate cyclase (GGDEF)-like protein/PAS domain S-box-containing protein